MTHWEATALQLVPVLSLNVGQWWPLALNWAVNLVAAILIIIIGWSLARWASRWVERGFERLPAADQTLRPLSGSIVRYGIVFFTLMAVLERFGVQTASVIAVLGAAGIAVGLAIQGTLANVASGVMLLILRNIRAGENVSLGGYSGKVREVGLFRTILISEDGLYVSIPNSAIFSGPIVNHSREPLRRVSFKFHVSDALDLKQVQLAALEILHRDVRVLARPEPAVLVQELGAGDVTLAVEAWVPSTSYAQAHSDLQRDVRDRLRQFARPGNTLALSARNSGTAG